MTTSQLPALKVVLVDVNRAVTDAWEAVFADVPNVEIVRGSITARRTDAWVTPTNSLGRMDGGVDAAVNRHFRGRIQALVQDEIAKRYGGTMPVGAATCVPTGGLRPRFLISTPTMVQSAQDISDTLNVALACAAAFQAVHMQNAKEPGSIESLALPGLGAATGRVPPRVCANLMWTAFTLFSEYVFRDYDTLRTAVLSQLGGHDLEGEEPIRVSVPKELDAQPFVVGPNANW
ncbi:macro domain-containing protein [Gemmata sp. JC673]|uniref:Macro domain-containing protein n=1 Tax=Gemmata algarum TaxID=2975278 RepID=A0ABU5EVW2_9BACT|nr:macro domain-containing protein [Gemmata algarum]MDY3557774.1 macro domain-containing protein [Gemmata algarum]